MTKNYLKHPIVPVILFLVLSGAHIAFAGNGTVIGTPTFGVAKFGNGLVATSDANYINLPTGTFTMTSSSSWTIEAWLKTTTVTGVQVAISSGVFGDLSRVIWLGVKDGKFAASVTGTGAFTNGPQLDSGISISDGAWHHVAMVMVGGTALKLFVDGIQGGGDFIGQIDSPPNNHTSGEIGAFPIATSFSWPGGIDEVAFWNTNKYVSNFTPPVSTYTGSEANLVALYHLQSDGTDSIGPIASPSFFVQQTQTIADASSASTIVGAAQNNTTGNLIVVLVSYDDQGNIITSTVSDTAGNVYTPGTKINGTDGTTSRVYYAKNIIGNLNNVVTATLSATTDFRSMTVLEYTGIDKTAPLDVEATPKAATLSTSLSSNIFTTTNSNDMIVALSTGIPSFVAGAGYTLRSSGNYEGTEDQHVNSIQTGVTATFTSGNAPYNFHVMAFKDATPGFSASLASIVQNSTGNVVTLTGTGTAWTAGTPGTPTFTLNGGNGASITSQTVTSATSATITLTAGSAVGTLTITDPSTTATASISVTTPSGTINADDSNIVYTGRWSLSGNGASARAKTINAGAYFDATVTGTQAISLMFDETGLNASGFPDILYQVDGGAPTRVTLSTGAGMIVPITFPIPSISVHRLRVTAEGVTEGSNPAFNQWTSLGGVMSFKGLTVDSGATTSPIPTNKNTIEFLGDSLVASVRQLSNCGGGSFSNANCMAAHNSWAMQTAQYLGLRAVITGFGASGLTVTGSGGVPIANNAFPFVFAGASYAPAQKPTAVVVAQGTNDGGASGATFRAALTAYLATIRAAYPKTYIFSIGLPSNPHAADMGTVITGLGDNKAFYLNYTALPLTTTDGTHFDTAGANVLAAKLSSDIQTQLDSLGVVMGAPSGGGTKAFLWFQ